MCEEVKAEAMELQTLPERTSDIDVQVVTAKRFPRSLSKFRKEAEAMALIDAQTASECFYVVPRKGKQLEGPSVRLAEIIAYSYGNLRVDVSEPIENDETVTVTSTCFDLERNVAIRVTASKSIVGKNGRYSRDMITVTGNAATSVALRNSVFRVVPKPVWKEIYDKARKTSITGQGTLTEIREKAIKYFTDQGIKEYEIYDILDVDGIEDIKEDQIITLRGMYNAIKDGEMSIREMFGKNVGKESKLNERLKVEPEEGQNDKTQEQLDLEEEARQKEWEAQND